MQQKRFFQNLREGRKALTELGIDPGYMSMKEMAEVYRQELKRRGDASKLPVAAKAAIKAAVPTIGDLKALLAKEKNPVARLDMLDSIRATLRASLEVAKSDAVKSTEICRELNRVEKAAAYESLALQTESPAVAKARRIREFSNLD